MPCGPATVWGAKPQCDGTPASWSPSYTAQQRGAEGRAPEGRPHSSFSPRWCGSGQSNPLSPWQGVSPGWSVKGSPPSLREVFRDQGFHGVGVGVTGSGGGSPYPTPSGGQGNRPLWSSLVGVPPESPLLSAKAMQTEEEASNPLHLETAIPSPPPHLPCAGFGKPRRCAQTDRGHLKAC